MTSVRKGLSIRPSAETGESGDRFGGRTVGWNRVKVVRWKLRSFVQGDGFAGGSNKADDGT